MSKEKIKCFLVKETTKAKIWARRFRWSKEMKGDCGYRRQTYHNARNFWRYAGNVPGTYTEPIEVTEKYKKQLPFPKKCPCGYEFRPEDEWQIMKRTIWQGERNGEVIRGTLDELPAGAMWEAWWYKDDDLHVKLPNGSDWNTASKATNGGGWDISGTPPNITASPSIGIQDKDGNGWAYHGWLRNGFLIEV